jgi:hypothetical protein
MTRDPGFPKKFFGFIASLLPHPQGGGKKEMTYGACLF